MGALSCLSTFMMTRWPLVKLSVHLMRYSFSPQSRIFLNRRPFATLGNVAATSDIPVMRCCGGGDGSGSGGGGGGECEGGGGECEGVIGGDFLKSADA